MWLGIDHSWLEKGPPLIFETMVFVDIEPMETLLNIVIDREGTEVFRWATEAAAMAGHERLVAELRGQIGEPAHEEAE